jgi:hypothetical protein
VNKAQKIAWFNLAVVMAGSVFVITLAVLEAVKLMVIVMLTIVAVVGISPLIFRKKEEHIDFDERDKLIRVRAWFFASFVSFFWLITQCVTWSIFFRQRGFIQANILIGLPVGAVFTFIITKSYWTLFEYRYGKQ